jgi:hypothetical protein
VSRRRHWIITFGLVVACVVALTGCGVDQATETVADANNNGVYINAGAITYQLQISRELNQYDTEDMQYLTGLPPGTTQPGPAQLWYGVFLWAKNQTNQPQTTPPESSFVIVDTQGNKYYPLKLDTSVNPYAWREITLQPSETQPQLDTPAANGPTQGSLLLFKLSDIVYSNRPLTLFIYAQGASKPSTISLDL